MHEYRVMQHRQLARTQRAGVIVTLLLIMMMVGVSIPAQARLIDDLFSAEVEINSQSSQQRQQAIKEAFQQVIVKLTGQRQAVELTAIKQAQRQVSDYLVQYGFNSYRGQQTLTATFDGQKLRQLLADNQLPYWGSRRPQLLLWIVQEDANGKRKLLSSGDETVFAQQLSFLTQQMGVPIQLPLMDLTDAMNVSATDVWGRFLQPIRSASQRYAADGVLIGRLRQVDPRQANQDDELMSLDAAAALATTETASPVSKEPESSDEPADKVWQLDWYIEVDQQRLRGEVQADSRDWIAEPFVSQVQQEMASAFSVINSDQQQLVTLPVRVTNLNQWQDVIKLEEFLASVASVESVALSSYSTKASQFSVTVRGSADHLLQSIQLDGRLQSEQTSPFAEPQKTDIATYRWAGN